MNMGMAAEYFMYAQDDLLSVSCLYVIPDFKFHATYDLM